MLIKKLEQSVTYKLSVCSWIIDAGFIHVSIITHEDVILIGVIVSAIT